MSEYKLKTGKVGDAVVNGFKKIEDGVVGGYKKIENAFTSTFLEEVEKTEEPHSGVVDTDKACESAGGTPCIK